VITNGANLVKTLYVHYNIDEVELKWSDNYFDLAAGATKEIKLMGGKKIYDVYDKLVFTSLYDSFTEASYIE
jgi:hypothetical protein